MARRWTRSSTDRQLLFFEARRSLIELSTRSASCAEDFIRNGNGSPGNARDTRSRHSRDVRWPDKIRKFAVHYWKLTGD
jgi:hypothetical protein